MEKFTDVKSWLKTTYSICVSDDWLFACLEFIQQETNSSVDSAQHLRSLVYEQWLSSDLSEIGEPTLQAGISDVKKMEIMSSYPLQILSIVDVGFPLFGQKQKLQGKDNPNAEVSADKPFQPGWEPKPCRMLMMKLTDGHQLVQAMEYKQIRSLHAHLPSGTKIIITGPLLCRNGVLFLCEENVQVLGGEVDALIETNTQLSNLEAMMEQNRLNEGKSSSMTFSGKFITRGSDEKVNLKMKYSMKKECSLLDRKADGNPQNQGRSFNFPVKDEIKVEPQHSFLKQESCEDNKDFEWEDDIDYDALFDDAMDCMDDPPSVVSTSKPQVKNESSSCLLQKNQQALNHNRNPVPPKFSSPAVKLECRSAAINLSSVPFSSVPPYKVEDSCFDDDIEAFEMDDIDDSFSPCIAVKSQSEFQCVDFNQKKTPIQNIKKDKSFSLCKSTEESQSKTLVHFNSAASNDVEVLNIDDFDKSTKDKSKLKHLGPRKSMPHQSISSEKGFNAKSFSPLGPAENPQPQTSVHVNSAASSPLSQLEWQASGEQSTAIESSASTVHRSMSSKQESLFNSKIGNQPKTSHSFPSNKQSLSMPSLPKKAKQSKIFDWGISSSSKSTSLSDKKRKETVVVSSHNIEDRVSMASSSPSSCFGNDKSDSMSNDKGIFGSNPSSGASSSSDFSSPKVKNLPKAVIHPFTETGKETSDEAVPKRPYEYLSDLDMHRPGEAIIAKAYISTLTDKLGFAGGRAWTLSCRINDGTACLNVDLDNKVLTELIGFSAQESIVMRQKMKFDPSVKDILLEGLTQCQNKLINISCLMEIVTSSPGSKPVVTRFIPVTSEHVQQLKHRVDLLRKL